MPQIVVIDGHTLNPGDLDFSPLAELGELVVHERTAPPQVEARLREAEAVLTNKVPFDAARFDALPALRYLGVTATGYNIIDTAAAKRHGVTVTNVPTYGTDSVAQHTIALMLERARHLTAHLQAVAEGRWVGSADWCLPVAPVVELTGKTLGVVGYGRIGAAVAKIAAAMGMRIVAHTRSGSASGAGFVVEPVSLDTLFAESDVISLHCPLTEETRHLVNAARLQQMKPSALLINTSRGPLIDRDALAAALREEQIAGAALDVLDEEPPPADDPLPAAPRCVITGHVAWWAREARQRLLDQSVTNLRAFLQGEPINVVS
jgi:glycerate dehydrogenase